MQGCLGGKSYSTALCKQITEAHTARLELEASPIPIISLSQQLQFSLSRNSATNCIKHFRLCFAQTNEQKIVINRWKLERGKLKISKALEHLYKFGSIINMAKYGGTDGRLVDAFFVVFFLNKHKQYICLPNLTFTGAQYDHVKCSLLKVQLFFYTDMTTIGAARLWLQAVARDSQRLQSEARNPCGAAASLRALTEHTKLAGQALGCFHLRNLIPPTQQTPFLRFPHCQPVGA